MILFDDENNCVVCKIHKNKHNPCQLKACKTGYWSNSVEYVETFIHTRIKNILDGKYRDEV